MRLVAVAGRFWRGALAASLLVLAVLVGLRLRSPPRAHEVCRVLVVLSLDREHGLVMARLGALAPRDSLTRFPAGVFCAGAPER